MFNDQQKKQILDRSIKIEDALKQIESLKEGFPYVQIERPCTLGDGIVSIINSDESPYLVSYQKAAREGRVSLFVPASGAATRMFKALLTVDAESTVAAKKTIKDLKEGSKEEKEVFKFLTHLKDFPFYADLRQSLMSDQYDLEELLKKNNYGLILKYLLFEKGLNYASSPKGLIAFHQSKEGHSRTAFEEHLIEACQYAADSNKKIRIHFTISREFEPRIKESIKRTTQKLKKEGYDFEIEYSEQKPSTDTLAVGSEGDLFVTAEGQLLFRPGGHGALIENLNDLPGDIVFIKNIDNILPENANESVILTQKLLGGMLVDIQARVFSTLKALHQNKVKKNLGSERLLQETAEWAAELFGFQFTTPKEQAQELFAFLNRPIRVCGMVKNEGEPGGGPFWVRSLKGQLTPQIVEASQIDFASEKQKKKTEEATHFNPVNMVCGLLNFQGQSFDLKNYIDPKTAFVSEKSFEGRSLKALELPGLWNGAMADWLTVFVDVPLETFAPVKELNDLLRPAHQKWKEFL